MDRNWAVPAAIIAAIVILFCCLCVFCIAIFGFFMQQQPIITPPPFGPTEEAFLPTPADIYPTPVWDLPTPVIPDTPLATQAPLPTLVVGDSSPVPVDTLNTLNEAVVPVNNLVEMAERLSGKVNIPETIPAPATPFRPGDRREFWVTNTDTNESAQVEAVLRYISDHVYFWIEDGVTYDDNEVRDLVDAFEEEMYPVNREFFGSEWSPGIDNDPHLYILYTRGMGSSVAGYFSSADEYHPLAHEYSNAAEMFLLSADNVFLWETFTYGVLAHEFQHMIHWYRDRNETSWMNEGFSELAMLLTGYYESGFDLEYIVNPDLQLNDWPNDSDATRPHYGAGFLFLTYFLDRFGEDATKALVADANNGMSSIDGVLASIQAADAATGEPIRADDLFADWAVTNYLLDSSVGDGRFTYRSYENASQVQPTEMILDCPTSQEQRTVNQYGVDYILFDCTDGAYTLYFQGARQVGVVPADPYSGEYAFWSNKGDESDMRLTQSFDFSNVSGPLTLSYRTWYDLETDYDYLYLLSSQDNGQTWQFLITPGGTAEDPSGNSYGWGYNALSGGGDVSEWVEQSVDLSQFAGKQVLLRFEYVTDAAVNGEGFLLDDITIPETGYFSDFEQDDGGWQAEGWVRIRNILPQTYRLELITRGRETRVTYIPVQADGSAVIPVTFGSDVQEAILVVSGTTRFTRQQATYQFWVDR